VGPGGPTGQECTDRRRGFWRGGGGAGGASARSGPSVSGTGAGAGAGAGAVAQVWHMDYDDGWGPPVNGPKRGEGFCVGRWQPGPSYQGHSLPPVSRACGAGNPLAERWPVSGHDEWHGRLAWQP
jgi:hypothetical protein